MLGVSKVADTATNIDASRLVSGSTWGSGVITTLSNTTFNGSTGKFIVLTTPDGSTTVTITGAAKETVVAGNFTVQGTIDATDTLTAPGAVILSGGEIAVTGDATSSLNFAAATALAIPVKADCGTSCTSGSLCIDTTADTLEACNGGTFATVVDFSP